MERAADHEVRQVLRDNLFRVLGRRGPARDRVSACKSDKRRDMTDMIRS
jgi:hypothetical protein